MIMNILLIIVFGSLFLFGFLLLLSEYKHIAIIMAGAAALILYFEYGNSPIFNNISPLLRMMNLPVLCLVCIVTAMLGYVSRTPSGKYILTGKKPVEEDQTKV